MDAKLARLRPMVVEPPRGGWVKAIRESLGMSAEQLGARLGIGKQGALGLEASESRRSVTLASLERAARALGGQLTYAIVPAKPLEELVDDQAARVAREQLKGVSHTMSLEAQEPSAALHELLVNERAKELKEKLRRELWDER
jgi:predicted DNA-binding mobile mystery protein A